MCEIFNQDFVKLDEIQGQVAVPEAPMARGAFLCCGVGISKVIISNNM